MQANHINKPVLQLLDVVPASIEKLTCNDGHQFYQNIHRILCDIMIDSDQVIGTKFAFSLTNDSKASLDKNNQRTIFTDSLKNNIVDKSILPMILCESEESIKLQDPKFLVNDKFLTNQFDDLIALDQSEDHLLFTQLYKNILENRLTELMDTGATFESHPQEINSFSSESLIDFDTLSSFIASNKAAITLNAISSPVCETSPSMFFGKGLIVYGENNHFTESSRIGSEKEIFVMLSDIDRDNLKCDVDNRENTNDSILNNFRDCSRGWIDNSGKVLSVSISNPNAVAVDFDNSSCDNSLLSLSKAAKNSIDTALGSTIVADEVAFDTHAPICSIISLIKENLLPDQGSNLLTFCFDPAYIDSQGRMLPGLSSSNPNEVILENDNSNHGNSFLPTLQSISSIITVSLDNSIIIGDIKPSVNLEKQTKNTDNFLIAWPNLQYFLFENKKDVSDTDHYKDDTHSGNHTQTGPMINANEKKILPQELQNSNFFNLDKANDRNSDPIDIDYMGQNDLIFIPNLQEVTDDNSIPGDSNFLEGSGLSIKDHREEDILSAGFIQTGPMIVPNEKKSLSRQRQNSLSFGFDQVNTCDNAFLFSLPSLTGIENNVLSGIKNGSSVHSSFAWNKPLGYFVPYKSMKDNLASEDNNGSSGINEPGDKNTEITKKLLIEPGQQIPSLDLVSMNSDDNDVQSVSSLVSVLNKNQIYTLNDRSNIEDALPFSIYITKNPEIDRTCPLPWESPVALANYMDWRHSIVDAKELCQVLLSPLACAEVEKQHYFHSADTPSDQGIADSMNPLDSMTVNYKYEENVKNKLNITDNILYFVERDPTSNYSHMQISNEILSEVDYGGPLLKDTTASSDINFKPTFAIPILSENIVQNNFETFSEKCESQSEGTEPVLLEPKLSAQHKSAPNRDADLDLSSDFVQLSTTSLESENKGSRCVGQKISLNKKLSATDYSKSYRFEAQGEAHSAKRNNNLSETTSGHQTKRVEDARNSNSIKESVLNSLFENWEKSSPILENQEALEVKYGLSLTDSKENPGINSGIKLNQLATKSPEERQQLVEKSIIDQVVSKARVEINGGNAEIKIEIRPKIFGNIKIHLLKENHQIIAHVTTENSYVKELIERQIHLLRNELHDQRIDIQEINVFIHKEDENFNSQMNNQSESEKRPADALFFDQGPDIDRKEKNKKPVVSEAPSSETNIDYYA